jgi:F-type H+-transporting ATPase subunit a
VPADGSHVQPNVFTVSSLISASFASTLCSYSIFCDPLEQFDVLSIAHSVTALGFTNLALLLTFNTIVIAVWLASYNNSLATTYDFALRSLYQLVKSIVNENLYIHKQQYFTVVFFLFLTLMVANLVGMVPYSFTITSSFVVTFFLALTHFVAINHLAAVRYG